MGKSKNNRKKKKKGVQAPKRLTPEQYIFQKARSLPIAKVYINHSFAEDGIANIAVLRQQPSGTYIMGSFLVDILCLGVKDTFFRFGVTWSEFEEEYLEKYNADEPILIEVVSEDAHGIIKDSLEYAASLGISPHKDFRLTQYILEPLENIPNKELKRSEQPIYATLKAEYNPLVIAALNKSVGDGNYEVLIKSETFNGDEWEEE